MLNNDNSQSAAIIGNHRRWPKATIPYVLATGDFSISLWFFILFPFNLLNAKKNRQNGEAGDCSSDARLSQTHLHSFHTQDERERLFNIAKNWRWVSRLKYSTLHFDLKLSMSTIRQMLELHWPSTRQSGRIAWRWLRGQRHGDTRVDARCCWILSWTGTHWSRQFCNHSLGQHSERFIKPCCCWTG